MLFQIVVFNATIFNNNVFSKHSNGMLSSFAFDFPTAII